MPDPMERLRAMLFDQRFQAFAANLLRQNGHTTLPPGFSSPGEAVLDYYARTDPAAIGRMLQAHEQHSPPAAAAPPPAQQQPAAPKPQQQPQPKIDPQTRDRILKLLDPAKVAAQAAKMKGSSAVRQFLTPEFERSAAVTLKKLGAVIPEGHTAGATMLAGLSLFRSLPPADVALFARETRGAFGDATELRHAISKLTTHDMADEVTRREQKQQEDMDRARYGPNGKPKVEVPPDKWSTRDAVAAAYEEAKQKAGPPTPRRVYSRQQLDEARLLNKVSDPGDRRPIEMTRELTREIAQEARDRVDAATIVDDGSGGAEPTAAGASDG
jgi:hypothetical protein